MTDIQKVTQGSVQLPILRNLLALGADSPHACSTVTSNALKEMGVDLSTLPPEEKKRIENALGNGAFTLRQKGCLASVGRAEWKITTLGCDVATGKAEMPKAPSGGTQNRVNKPKPTPTEGSENAGKPSVEAPHEKTVSLMDAVASGEVVIHSVKLEPTPAPPVPVEVTANENIQVPAVEAPTNPTPIAVPTTPAPVATQETAAAVSSPPEVQVETNKGGKEENLDDLAERLHQEGPRTGKRTKVASLAVIPDGAEEWVRDPYLRSLVQANTLCFGSWSPSEAPCGKCPVASFCRYAQAAALSVLSQQLRETELTEKAKRLHAATATALSPATSRDPSKLVEGREYSANNDGVCARTGQEFRKGQKVVWIPGEGVVLPSAARTR